MKIQLSNRTQLILFLFVVGLMVFKPSPGMLLGGGVVSLIIILVELIAGLVLVLYLFNQNQYPNTLGDIIKDNKRDYVTIFILFTMMSLVVSNTWGILKSPQSSSFVDYFEMYRFLMYLVFYYVAKYVTISGLKKLLKPTFIMIIIVELIAVLQLFNIFNFNNHIGLLFILNERHYDMILKIHRVPSTFFNPNLYGTFLVLSAALVLGYISFKGKFSWKSIFLLLTIFISVYLTTSRTAVLTITGITGYWIIINSFFIMKFSIKRFISSLLVLVVFLLVGSLLIPQIPYLDYASKQIAMDHEVVDVPRDSTTGELEEDENNNENENESGLAIRKLFKKLESVSSFQKRFEFWEMNLEKFLESPIVGNGLMENNFITFADNQYLYILARYGLLGFLIYGIFYIGSFFKTLFMLKKDLSKDKKSIALAINLSIAGFAFAGLTSEALFNLQTITILFVLFGLLNNKTLKGDIE
ncbi:O-antigen ligase family protein [Bacillus sp. 2205SS5-2]|uniref:O-antigen ligase family protein n=1 Tax=Bacillus sp. 2205SS5-2 TaxID=3109031 RepID=UPI0030078256